MSKISCFFKKFINNDLLTIESESGKLSLFSLAIPLFISAISIHLIAVLQTALASRYADGFFVIPISVSNSLLGVIHYILVMVATGTNILLSIAIGKNDKERCKRLFGTAAILIGIFSIVLLSITCIFAEPLLRLMASGNSEFSIYITASVIYFRIRLIEVCLQVFYTLINNVLQCYGYTKLGLICGITTNLLTFILCWIFLFVIKVSSDSGAYVFGFTAVFSNIVGIIIAISIFIHRKISVSFKFDKSLAKDIFAVGAPASVSMIFYSLSQMITTTICLKLTPDMYLAKTYVTSIVYFVYVFGYSIGQAAATMVGFADLTTWIKRINSQNKIIA